MRQKKCTPELLESFRLLSGEVPDNCTPAEAWEWIRPITKRGEYFVPYTFWANLEAKCLFAPGHQSDRDGVEHMMLARWISNQCAYKKQAGGKWPPVALTRKPKNQPQPWTGKTEKPNTAIPWDGKK